RGLFRQTASSFLPLCPSSYASEPPVIRTARRVPKCVSLRRRKKYFRVRAHRPRQSFKVVSAFQNGDHASAGVFVGHLQNQTGKLREIGILKAKTAERIAEPRIEAGRNQE